MLGRRLRERLLAAGLGLLLVLVAIELGLRLLGGSAPAPTAEGSLRPAVLQCPTCPRILCLGDSFTYGIGATPGGDFPSQLEALLAPRHPQLQVLNAGIGGANTGIVLSTMPEFLRVTRPLAIVVLVGNSNRVNLFGYRAWKAQSSLLGRVEQAAYRVRLLRLLRHSWVRLHPARSTDDIDVGHAIASRYFVRSYLRWWRRNHDSDWPSEHFRRGLELLAVGERQAAAQAFDEGLSEHGADAAHLWGIGTCHRVMHDHDGARRWFEDAIAADPGDPNPYFAMGDIYLDQGRPVEDALPWFERGLRADPAFGANHCGRAGILFRTQGPEAAWDADVEGLRADPSEDLCYRDLMENARLLGRQQQARELLEELVGDAPVAQGYLTMLDQRSLDDEFDAWVRDELRSIAALADARGVPVLFLTYPFPSPANPVLRQVAQEHDDIVVGVEAVFQQTIPEDQTRREQLFVRDGHCNDRGYALMARAVGDVLEQQVELRAQP